MMDKRKLLTHVMWNLKEILQGNIFGSLDKLGEIKHMIELLKVSYGMILNGDDEPKVSKGQVFNALVANFVLGSSFIKQNPGNLYVRVITALIEGTEFS